MNYVLAFVIATVLVLALQPDSLSEVTAQAQHRMVTTVPQSSKPATDDHARENTQQHVVPTATAVPHGDALAVMRVPRFGVNWEWVAVEGVADADIALGPGHYPRTALPGEEGNVVIAGHRSGYGDPFIDFDLLRPGDRVTFSQGTTRWIYAITSQPHIIDVTDNWVLEPLAGRRLTLTTCWPKYGSSKRMYVRGQLISVNGHPTVTTAAAR